jgi:hypothetical protein
MACVVAMTALYQMCVRSLADAEARKEFAEHIIGSAVSRDDAKFIERASKFGRNKLRRLRASSTACHTLVRKLHSSVEMRLRDRDRGPVPIEQHGSITADRGLRQCG